MNVKTVAEFAESQAIVEQLKAMGVDYAQGYGVSMPAPLIGPVPRSDPLQRPLITATETAPVA
jgi:EAL domain-containing protein (putative c-di-GMP-specific phosphodiesterase class I)